MLGVVVDVSTTDGLYKSKLNVWFFPPHTNTKHHTIVESEHHESFSKATDYERIHSHPQC